MKFARRAEGIKSARTVFKRAREDTRSRFHVFVAAALMEYYCSKDKNIAFRIFELGLKKFSDNPEYILCYIDYLSHLNGKYPMCCFETFTFHSVALTDVMMIL
jgi:cleavage stimulation factor subunit 3